MDLIKIAYLWGLKFVVISFLLLNIQKICISLVLEFVGSTLHENHENLHGKNIKQSTVQEFSL